MYNSKCGLYFCDKCGAVIDGDPTVIDTNDWGVNVDTDSLEGIEVCADCYLNFMGEQKEICQRFLSELKFNWRKDKEE